jgi:hypothetical protein
LQRINPVESETEYNKIFGELLALETARRHQHDMAIGDI